MGDGDSTVHETSFINAFVVGSKRKRMIQLLSSTKRRSKAINELHHFQDLDSRFCDRIPSHLQSSTHIYHMLREKGAPESCYIIGAREFDGKHVDLREALDQVVCSGIGTFISCVSGCLGYYEGENPGERYILERKSR